MSVTPTHYPPKPPGHTRVSEDDLEEFATRNGVPIHLPGDAGGWATTRYRGEKLCSLLAPKDAS